MTRRSLASDFPRTFDPLQFFGPYHTQVKFLFRELIPTDQQRDDPVSLSGELVIIKDESSSRYRWPLAIITELKPSPYDGLLSYAKLRLIHETKDREIRRGIHKLVPIERSPGRGNVAASPLKFSQNG